MSLVRCPMCDGRKVLEATTARGLPLAAACPTCLGYGVVVVQLARAEIARQTARRR